MIINDAAVNSLYPVDQDIFHTLFLFGVNELNNFVVIIDEIEQIEFTPITIHANDFLHSRDLKIVYENEQ